MGLSKTFSSSKLRKEFTLRFCFVISILSLVASFSPINFLKLSNQPSSQGIKGNTEDRSGSDFNSAMRFKQIATKQVSQFELIERPFRARISDSGNTALL